MARLSKEERDIIRTRIIDVSRRMFVDDGYEETSTKRIAKEVGIAEGTIFNYFDSKPEIFLEAIGKEYDEKGQEFVNELVLHDDISTVIVNHIFKTAGAILKVPRRIMKELIIASIKLTKKNPERFKKFVELDFRYMREVESYFEFLSQKGILSEVDTKHLSEIIYGTLAFEVIMYLYDKDITIEDVKTNIKTKTNIILKAYI